MPRTIRRAAPSPKLSTLLSRSAVAVMSACLSRAEAVLYSSGIDGTNDHALDLGAAAGGGGNGNAGGGGSGTSGAIGGHPGLARAVTALFSELLRTLELPAGGSASAAHAAVLRASLFALHWSLAALAVAPATRTALLLSIPDAAVMAVPEAAAALPPDGSGGLGGHLLGPKTGEWVPWTRALTGIMDLWDNTSHRVKMPKHPAASRMHLPLADAAAVSATAAGEYHLYHPYDSPWAAGGSGAGGRGTAGGAARPGPHSHHPATSASFASSLFVPSACSCALQYVAALSLRAGLQPCVVGGADSGKRSLLRHLLSCWRLHGGLKTEAVRPSLAACTAPSELQELLMWHLVPGGLGTLRPRSGRQVVMVLEDLHVPAQVGIVWGGVGWGGVGMVEGTEGGRWS